MRAPWFLPAFALCLSAQAPLSLQAPIGRVRLHPEEAWVTRTGKVRLPGPGTHRVLLEGLLPGLRLEDIQTSARGPAGLRLGDVSLASDVRKVTETSEWKQLQAEREAFQEKRDALEAQLEAIEYELKFLKDLQAVHDKELSSRMTYVPPQTNAVLDFSKGLKGRMSELLQSRRQQKRALEKVAKEETRLDAEMNKRRQEQRIAPTRVMVELTTSQGGEAEVELTYRTTAAHWKPQYEARLSEDRRRLTLSLSAAVAQNTGESWNDIRLEISNARPSRNLVVPAFTRGTSIYWAKNTPPPPPPTQSELKIAGASGVTQNFIVDAPSPAVVDQEQEATPNAAAAESVASVIEEASGLAATFLVEGLKDVPSDGEPHRFKVQTRDLDPKLSLFTSPRLDPTAYLMARFTAPTGFPLFPGSPVVRFVGNQRLGDAPLTLPPAGQPFALGFGPYKSLRISFQHLAWKQEEVGAFTKDRQWTFRERIELTNDGSDNLELEVQDRILKAASDQVKVILLPEFTAGSTEPIPGVRSWTLQVAPQEQKRIEMPITVRVPKDGIVLGLEDLLGPET